MATSDHLDGFPLGVNQFPGKSQFLWSFQGLEEPLVEDVVLKEARIVLKVHGVRVHQPWHGQKLPRIPGMDMFGYGESN